MIDYIQYLLFHSSNIYDLVGIILAFCMEGCYNQHGGPAHMRYGLAIIDNFIF